MLSFGADWPKSSNTDKGTITILIPPVTEKAYEIAGASFAEMWEKVTGQRPVVLQMEQDNTELPEGDIILIGSDSDRRD